MVKTNTSVLFLLFITAFQEVQQHFLRERYIKSQIDVQIDKFSEFFIFTHQKTSQMILKVILVLTLT